jgi:hypothetical protein
VGKAFVAVDFLDLLDAHGRGDNVLLSSVA